MKNFLINNYNYYLSLKNNGFNPFALVSNTSNRKINHPKSDKDEQDEYIRCPICLRLTWNPIIMFFQGLLGKMDSDKIDFPNM